MEMVRFLELLNDVQSAGNGHMALCPVHKDTKPSLHVSMGADGRILLKCFAGCSAESIVHAVGLEMKDLFNGHCSHFYPPVLSEQVNRLRENSGNIDEKAKKADQAGKSKLEQANRFNGCTLEMYAAAKKLSVDFLHRCDLDDIKVNNIPSVRMPYMDNDRVVSAVRYRLSMDGDDRFRWRAGDKLMLYGLWRLNTYSDEYIILVEGESDCHTLWQNGIPALGIPGASSWKDSRDAHFLSRFKAIFVIIEPGAGGEKVFGSMSGSSLKEKIHIVRLPQKDTSALFIDDTDQFMERFQEALSQAEPIKTEQRKKLRDQGVEAWKNCKELAEAPDIIEQVVRKIKKMGVVGEERAVKLLYLSLTSRVFSRPISVVIKGTSSTGKSFVLESILKLMPLDSYYALTAMSDRALAYTDENLQHRFVILYEAAGLNSEFQSYLIRTLLSEGRIEYEFVEKTPEGMKPRRVKKEGPTGFICTTTLVSLHPENETRMLSITSNDSPEQTRNIIAGIAKQSSNHEGCDQFISLQKWLSLQPSDVYIPFAEPLANLIPPVAVRLRRDFTLILNLIKAHAFLCQCSRETDEQGRIIATLDDYAIVHDLVHDVIAHGVDATVPESVRKVVGAVRQLADEKDCVTTRDVAKHLRLDRQASQRRLRQAEKSGFVVNDNPGKGKTAKYIIGDPMPEDTEIIPSPSRLRDYLLTCPPEQTRDKEDDQVGHAEFVDLTGGSEDLLTCSPENPVNKKVNDLYCSGLPAISDFKKDPGKFNDLRDIEI